MILTLHVFISNLVKDIYIMMQILLYFHIVLYIRVSLSVVIKRPDSQSGKLGSIPGTSKVNQAEIGCCPPLGR